VGPDSIEEQLRQVMTTEHALVVLRAIDDAPLRPTDVGDRIGRTKQRAGQLLDELARHGLAKSEADETDRRAVRWRATIDGRAVLRAVEEITGSTRGGWVVSLKLGPTGKRVLAQRLLEELNPTHLYRVVGDLDFVAISQHSEASPDLLADLRRRLHEVALVEGSHIGHMLGKSTVR